MHQPPTFEVDGDAIREERMRAGVEIADMAARAGLSRRYLSHLETGSRRRMRPGRYAALREALDVIDDRLLATDQKETE
ncbi:helix-turn-helix domain-containing protein [Streptomyces uncialis]|uniref:helix-turn-helix domain-containing protein n=1 Tax=Streptomyces uncialis TaxID=1048205 RepID=UPI00380CAB5A